MIVVTGPMRSGTSLVAQLLCKLRVHMGSTMAIPVGHLLPEYEPVDFILPLMQAAFDHNSLGARQLTAHYTYQQEALYPQLQQAFRLRDWGVKSPVLALTLDAIPIPFTLITTTRDPADCQKSLEHACTLMTHPDVFLTRMSELQQRITDALEHCTPDLTIPFTDPIEHKVRALAEIVAKR